MALGDKGVTEEGFKLLKGCRSLGATENHIRGGRGNRCNIRTKIFGREKRDKRW